MPKPLGSNINYRMSDASVSKPVVAVAATRPAATQIFWKICIWIILLEFANMLAMYAIKNTMNWYAWTYLGMEKVNAHTLKSGLNSVIYLFGLFGGLFADLIGKTRTLCVGLAFYVVGMLLMFIGVLPVFGTEPVPYPGKPHPARLGLYLLGVFVFAVGCGTVKAPIIALGADQYDEDNVEEYEARKKYFSWFYITVQIGGTLGGFAPQLFESDPIMPCIVTAIALGLMIIFGGLFFVFRNRYIEHGNPHDALSFYRVLCTTVSRSTCNRKDVPKEVSDPENGAVYERKSALQRASATFGGPCEAKAVEDTAQLLRLIPIFCVAIIFMLLYNQTSGPMTAQGVQMDDTQFNANSIGGVFDGVFMVVAILIIDYIIEPLCKKHNYDLKPINKMFFGMCFAILSALYFGGLEYWRISTPIIMSEVDGADSPKHALSAWAQLPGYFLMSCGEAFFFVSTITYFNNEAPLALRGTGQGLNQLTSAMSSWIGIGFEQGLKMWIPDNLDDGHFSYYCFVLAALMTATIGFYFVALWLYTSKPDYYTIHTERLSLLGEVVATDGSPCTTGAIVRRKAFRSGNKSSKGEPELVVKSVEA